MKCKYCKEEIKLTIFGMSKDVCWNCLNNDKKGEILDKNINKKKKS